MPGSTKHAMPESEIARHVGALKRALYTLVESPGQNRVEWREVSHCVEMCEVFVSHNGGVWKGSAVHGLNRITLADGDGIVQAGGDALLSCGAPYVDGEAQDIHMSPEAGATLYELVDMYEEILGALVESEVLKCRRIADERIKQRIARECGYGVRKLGPVRQFLAVR